MPAIERRPTPRQDAFALFLLECEARRFTQATQIHYKSRVGAFVAFCSAEVCNTLQGITPTLVRRFMVSLQAKDLAAYTQHAYYRAIRAWLNFCLSFYTFQSEIRRCGASSSLQKVQSYKMHSNAVVPPNSK